MTLIAFFGGIETGLIYALVALGVLISFRILDFPDLTADGSFPLGAVVFAVSVGAGVNPWPACLAHWPERPPAPLPPGCTSH